MEYVVAFLFCLLIGVFFTRWVFDIPSIVNNLKKQTIEAEAQTNLLRLLCKQQGISDEEIIKTLSKERKYSNSKAGISKI